MSMSLVFYLYALLGMSVFNCRTGTCTPDSPFDYRLVSFDSFGRALLSLLQVICSTTWMNQVYDYGFKLDNFQSAALFFNTFHVLVSTIMMSLIKGIVIEVFREVED